MTSNKFNDNFYNRGFGSSEACLTHLKSNHLNDSLPRFHKRKYIKNKITHFTKIPIIRDQSYISHLFISPSYQVINPFHWIETFRIQINHQTYLIPPFDHIRLQDDHIILNCGGGVVYSCINMIHSIPILCVSCFNPLTGIQLYSRRHDFLAEAYLNNGLISIYSFLNNEVLHIRHSHGYAVYLEWYCIDNQKLPNDVLGILLCLYVDGVIEFLNVVYCILFLLVDSTNPFATIFHSTSTNS